MPTAYPLKPFRISDTALMRRFIEAYPLATVISDGGDPDHVSLIPLMPAPAEEGEMRMLGHVDANNPHADQLVPGNALTFLFNGPNCYASPDIYPDAQLPGWLYVTIKGSGKNCQSD